MDVSTLQAAVGSLRADINTIFKARVLESEAHSVVPAEDTTSSPIHHLKDSTTSPSNEFKEA